MLQDRGVAKKGAGMEWEIESVYGEKLPSAGGRKQEIIHPTRRGCLNAKGVVFGTETATSGGGE